MDNSTTAPTNTTTDTGLLGMKCVFRSPMAGPDLGPGDWQYYDVQHRYCAFGCCNDDCCVPTAGNDESLSASLLGKKTGSLKSDAISGSQNPQYKSQRAATDARSYCQLLEKEL
ncbi:hypothetical protein BaRGS_00012648 [Batillaria attramentaria]|uniref:Uncharacterized protein n=1 Tax=Batillaria attramentaria TaxID=370345 RepID=A0ABD0LA46_9CAEN